MIRTTTDMGTALDLLGGLIEDGLGESSSPPARTLGIHRQGAAGLCPAQDTVIEEVPVAMVFNGLSHAVMLATPTHLDELALGFALAEGILNHPDELFDLEVLPGCDGVQVAMHIASARFSALKDRRRSLAGRTGCGLCGVDSLAAVHRIAHRSATSHQPLAPSPKAVGRALRELSSHQPLHQQTGAAHAAAWVAPSGAIQFAREDVGRHNALDKLIGHLAMARRSGQPLAAQAGGFVLVSSRASYEMVQKVACAGGRTLVAVSAPTAMAVSEAQAAGLLLIGFARNGRWTVYTHPERARSAQQPQYFAQ